MSRRVLAAGVGNPLRDPRWGRDEEGHREDARLTGQQAVAYGAGPQGSDPRHLKTAATLQHCAAYHGANPAATIAVIHDALDQGLLTPADIDDTVKQNLALRCRPGEFDPGGGPSGGASADEAANARLARETAAGSTVLLKNTGVPPLRSPKEVAVLGPPADAVSSDWHGGAMPCTSFRYGALRTGASTVDQRGTVRVGVDVTNTGARAGEEVVQLYTHQRTSRVEQPIRALRGFQRVHLEPGRTKRVMFTLAASDLRCWDVTRGRWVVEDATHDLFVGASSADLRATGQLRVRGETIPPRDLRPTTRAEHFDGNRGTTLLDEAKAGGTSVAANAAGQWVRYTDADLRGPAAFTGRFANTGAATTVQVRLDDPVNGPLLATVPVPATGDGYTTVTAALAADAGEVSGRHDVYLVFGGAARLATFTVS